MLAPLILFENRSAVRSSSKIAGNLAPMARLVQRAPPTLLADGYTLLLATTGVLAINQWTCVSPQYALPREGFRRPINIASTPNIIVVNPTVKAKQAAGS